jgi:hypothetical protein
MDDDLEYRQARSRVRTIKGFYVHVLVFVLVMALLLVINVATSRAWWVQWPFLGWGIGLVAHAAAVFGLAGWLGSEWEEQKIKDLMAKKKARG